MLRSICLLALLATPAITQAEDAVKITLDTPKGWSGETITLPPGFAKNMTWKGTEVIRFAPGMFKEDSDDFFTYCFVFHLPEVKTINEKQLQKEFLKYYRGLATTVARRKGGVNAEKFQLTVKPRAIPKDSKPKQDPQFDAVLDWTEPFRTMKPQRLYMEIESLALKDGNGRYLAVVVSPTPPKRGEESWTTMRRILKSVRFDTSSTSREK